MSFGWSIPSPGVTFSGAGQRKPMNARTRASALHQFELAISAGRRMLLIMKAFAMSALVAVVCLAFQPSGKAQYKAPSQYFPKSYPAPSAGGRASPAGTNGAAPQPPAQRAQPRFK